MGGKVYSHVIGFDDAPFQRSHRGDVLVIGAVYAGTRLDGVISGRVRRDGANATRVLIKLISSSRFAPQLQAVMLQGIAFAGFNVVDIQTLHQTLGLPVLVIVRKQPDFKAIRRALLTVRGGRRKWGLIEKAGAMEKMERVYVQRAGIEARAAAALIKKFAYHSVIPEPLRTSHMIAAGMINGASRQRV